MFAYLTFQCSSELSKLVEIAALHKGDAYYIIPSYVLIFFHWLSLLHFIYIYVHTFKCNWLTWFITPLKSYLNENGGIECTWLHQWFKLDKSYWLIHGLIFQPFKIPYGLHERVSPPLISMYVLSNTTGYRSFAICYKHVWFNRNLINIKSTK